MRELRRELWISTRMILRSVLLKIISGARLLRLKLRINMVMKRAMRIQNLPVNKKMMMKIMKIKVRMKMQAKKKKTKRRKKKDLKKKIDSLNRF